MAILRILHEIRQFLEENAKVYIDPNRYLNKESDKRISEQEKNRIEV